MPPFDPPPASFVDQVIENSRRVYSKQRVQVEEDIKKWHEADPAPELAKPKRDYSPAKKAPPSAVGPAYKKPSTPTELAPQKETAIIVPVPIIEAPPVAPEPTREPRPVVHHRPPAPAQKSVPDKPHSAKIPPGAPPLEGATSLRDALLQATGGLRAHSDKKPTPGPAAPAPAPTHNLKDALKHVAPKAIEPQNEAGLPKDELQSMLAVDPSIDLGAGDRSNDV
jgi:hypothetical protein